MPTKYVVGSDWSIALISVIIPTRNRSNLLAPALESLTRQTLNPDAFEVLVVDNGSTDDTKATAQEFTVRINNFRYLYEPKPGLHSGRHRGMLDAKGDILVFADDDIEALPTWLSSISEAFSDHDVVMVGGNNLPMFLTPPPSWLMKIWQRKNRRGLKSLPALSIIEFPSSQKEISPFLIWGCNFSIRKEVLLAAGGFHPDGMPKELIRFRGDGETHVSRHIAKTGLKCVFHQGATIYHKVTPERMTCSYFFQRGFNQGVSDSYTTLRNQDRLSGIQIRKRSIVFQVAKLGFQKLSNILTAPDVKLALTQLSRGHKAGYAYHQGIYREDPEVREWVHLKQYY